MSKDYQTHRLISRRHIFWTHLTSHNSHTHTSNTRQSEPQLKDSSCSFAISRHKSRDVIPSHNSRNAMCFPLSRATTQGIPFRAITQETLHKSIFKVSPKHCRLRTSKANIHYASKLSSGTTTESLREI